MIFENSLQDFNFVCFFFKIDTDNREHMNWIYENAVKRAQQFSIEGVTFKLTQGVVKNIIPAIASTNAIISALCANEAFKFITQVSDNLDNFQMNNGLDGHYSFTVSHEAEPGCLVCSTSIRKITLPSSTTVEQFLEVLNNDPSL
jgi:NEDD8-activating enzyme E1